MTRPKKALFISHEAATLDSFRRDPEFAMKYLDSVLENGDQKELMVALRRMSDAFGGVAQLATDAKLNPTTLYRTLSPQGNPELRSLTALLKAMGMRLAVRPITKTRGQSGKRKGPASGAAQRRGLP